MMDLRTIRLLRRHFKDLPQAVLLAYYKFWKFCNVPVTFTRLMTHVFDPFIHLIVIVYLGDICIYSKSTKEHLDHLRKVLSALRENKLFIKLVKCFWAKRETKYLGFVARFSYRTFIRHFKDFSAPLTDLCRKSLPGRVVHSDTIRVAFETLKARMISALVFSIPKSGEEAKCVVATDASKVDIAGVLL